MANLSQEKRLKMLEFLNTLKEEHKDNDEALKAIYEIENEITSKKYGLVWEEHEENVDMQMKTHVPVFTEIKEREIIGDENNPNFNFLLEGDNLHSLKLLEKTHKGKIDVIYIDPPYNRGSNDFIYDDDFVDTEDSFKHSKWLSFMSQRLKIGRELISNRGVIFISIDDNEYSQLKLLCDDIFGPRNFLGTYIKQSKVGGGNDSKFIVSEHEYCLVYSKKVDEALPMSIKHDDHYLKRYKEQDKNGRYFWDTFARPGLKNPIVYDIEAPDGTIINNGWIRSKERFMNEYKSGIVRIIQKKDGDWSVQFKQYLNQEGKTPRSFTMDFGGTNEGDKELKEIFGKKVFNYPKSTKYIKSLIETIPEKNITVLDFFAGSGTTGHAVMELNKEDGGNRRFILCTNNQNNIAEEITYKRIKKIIQGYSFKGKKSDTLKEYKLSITNLKKMDKIFDEFENIKTKRKDEYMNFSNQSKNGTLSLIGTNDIEDMVLGIAHNLKYYKTDFIPKVQDDEDDVLSDNLLSHIKEMVQLEHGIDIDNQKYHIILTDDDADRMEKEWDKYKECKALYISKNVLLTTSQNVLFSSVEINTIPDYYFESELREVGEIW